MILNVHMWGEFLADPLMEYFFVSGTVVRALKAIKCFFQFVCQLFSIFVACHCNEHNLVDNYLWISAWLMVLHELYMAFT